MSMKKEADFLACYNFRKTLTHLNLYCYSGHPVISLSKQNYLNLLTHFDNLMNLRILNPRNEDLTLFHVLDSCRNLSSLNFISYAEVPDHANELLNDMITINGKEVPKLTWSTLTHSQHLKSIFVDIPYLTVPYIKYIVSCTPISMENVDIATSHNGMLSWMQEYDKDIITEFVNRFKMVKTVKIMNQLYTNDLERIRREAVRVVIDSGQMGQLYMVLNTFKSDRNSSSCKAEYFFHSNDEVEDDIEQLSIEIHNGKDISVVYKLHTFEPLPPSGAKITTTASEVIDSLSLSTDRISTTAFEELLNYAFENYTYLTELEVVCYADAEIRILFYVSGDNDCSRQRGLMDTEDGSTELTKSYSNFTNVKLEGVIIAGSLPQLLSSALPNISSIQYTRCATYQNYSKYYLWQQDIDFITITSDLTQFENLKDLCIRGLDAQNVDYMLVQFIFTDTENAEYYEIKKSNDSTKKKYNFNSTTMDFINKCKEDSCLSPRLKTFSLMAFRCNRISKITLYDYDNDLIALFHLGVLQQ